MRKNPLHKKSFWFVLAVCLLVGYAIYDYKSDQWQDEKKGQQSLLYPHKSDQVQKVEILQGTVKDVELERTGEGWKLTKPIAEVADQDAVTDFVDGIGGEKSTSVAVEGDGIDWDRFGLGADAARISLTDNLGKVTQFVISSKKNFSGESFLRRDEEKKVFVGSSTWNEKMNKGADDFRDHRLAHLALGDIDAADFMVGKTTFHLKKKDAEWKSAERPDATIDTDKVRIFLGRLVGKNFQTLEGSPEGAPLVTFRLHTQSGKDWKGELFMSKNQKHIFKSGPPDMMGELSPQMANEFLTVSLEGFIKPPPTPTPTPSATPTASSK